MHESDEMGSKKHKKHKREKTEERPSGLKLILKVGSSSTPEHSSDSPGPVLPSGYSVAPTADEESMHSVVSLQPGHFDERQHKKAKKKKKKKEKDKDREKHDKKKKHHHKEKRKRLRDESSQDDVSMGEESLPEPPLTKHIKLEGDSEHGVHGITTAEPRICVPMLRQRQETRTPLQKLLDYLQHALEKRDPQQFFAWPVTDQIAPGYSQIIPQPMDFSTMRQKIDDNIYTSLSEYVEDFKLMCGNAMVYNHPDTIYYKAAKRLLHAGVKTMSPEKLKSLCSSMPVISQIPKDQLGFEIHPESERSGDDHIEIKTEEEEKPQTAARRGPHYLPESKFEAVPDDLTPQEILEQAQRAAQNAAEKLSLKKPNTKMGFLRTQKDGTTSLAILVPGEGLDPESNEKPVCLGQLIGKLNHGSGSLQGFREDRRNISKTVKPLYYGAFGSYAPSYDSTFANLSKEESDLVFQTYGDETAVQYAESILNFAKDCDYTLTMVDNLLDLLTGGDHRKTKKVLEERRRFREEEERVRQLMESKQPSHPQTSTNANDIKVEINQLKTLSELGIETSFLDYYEQTWKQENAMQERLDQTTVLLEKLQQVQSDRLSSTPPSHLANVMQPTDTELHLAEKITESLTELAKQVPPGAIVPVPAVRKAMGIVTEPQTLPGTASVGTVTENPPPTVETRSTQEQTAVSTPVERPAAAAAAAAARVCLDAAAGDDGGSSGGEEGVGVDLESELREFLESDTALSNFPLHDDKTIEEMLSES